MNLGTITDGSVNFNVVMSRLNSYGGFVEITMITSKPHFIRRISSRYLLVLLAPALVLVTSCSPGKHRLDSSGEQLGDPYSNTADPVLTYVGASPTAGRDGLVELSGVSPPLRVHVGRAYKAASGHMCRRYHLLSPESETTLGSHLACRAANGNWFQSRLFGHSGSLDGSESSGSGAAGS